MGTSAEHIEFIRLVAGGATYDSAYATSCNKNATSANARSQGSRLASKYAKEIAEAQQINKDIASQANVNAIIKTSEMRIISSARRMEILSDMAERMEEDTSNGDRVKAIAELNKMDGSYAPIKQDLTIKKGGLDKAEEKYE